MFLRFAAFKCGHAMQYIDHDYSNISKKLKIPNLESSLTRNDMMFGFKILNNFINCPELLSSFNFHVPIRNLRGHLYFYEAVVRFSLPIQRVSELSNNNSYLYLYNSRQCSFSKDTKRLFIYK